MYTAYNQFLDKAEPPRTLSQGFNMNIVLDVESEKPYALYPDLDKIDLHKYFTKLNVQKSTHGFQSQSCTALIDAFYRSQKIVAILLEKFKAIKTNQEGRFFYFAFSSMGFDTADFTCVDDGDILVRP